MTLKARSGKYHVYHAGKNHYVVTDGPNGELVATGEFLGDAFQKAMRLSSADNQREQS